MENPFHKKCFLNESSQVAVRSEEVLTPTSPKLKKKSSGDLVLTHSAE